MRDVRCLNCHSEDCHELLTVSDVNDKLHTYFKCKNCSLVFLHPLPSEEEMNKIYAQDYYGEGENEKFKAFFVVKLINTFARCRARRFASHLNNGARIMDLGCGNGRLLEHLHSLNRDFELHGIEIQPMAVLRASRRLKGRARIHTVNGLEQFFGKNAFDAISYVHVFEHLPDPAKTMDELAVVLRPGGTVMIVVPNIESSQSKRYRYNWFHLDPPRHLHFYPPGLLQTEMLNRGFEMLSERYRDMEQNPYGAVQSMLNCFVGKRDLLFERLKGNKKYAPQYNWFSVFMMKLFWLIMLPLCIIGDALASSRKQGATVEMVFRKNT